VCREQPSRLEPMSLCKDRPIGLQTDHTRERPPTDRRRRFAALGCLFSAPAALCLSLTTASAISFVLSDETGYFGPVPISNSRETTDINPVTAPTGGGIGDSGMRRNHDDLKKHKTNGPGSPRLDLKADASPLFSTASSRESSRTHSSRTHSSRTHSSRTHSSRTHSSAFSGLDSTAHSYSASGREGSKTHSSASFGEGSRAPSSSSSRLPEEDFSSVSTVVRTGNPKILRFCRRQLLIMEDAITRCIPSKPTRHSHQPRTKGGA